MCYFHFALVYVGLRPISLSLSKVYELFSVHKIYLSNDSRCLEALVGIWYENVYDLYGRMYVLVLSVLPRLLRTIFFLNDFFMFADDEVTRILLQWM